MSKKLKKIEADIANISESDALREKVQALSTHLEDFPAIWSILDEVADDLKEFEDHRKTINNLQQKISDLQQEKTTVWEAIKTEVDVFNRPLNEVIIEKSLAHGVYLNEYTFGKTA